MKITDSTPLVYETELVKKLRSGDSTAMKELYNTYRDRLYSLVSEYVDGDQDVAEDIVQETFLTVLNSFSKFRGDSQLYDWLCSIAQHKISDFHRHQTRKTKMGGLPSDIDVRELEQIEDTKPTALGAMELKETRHTVQQALVGLPSNYRQVLTLRYIEEMPVLRISQVMARSPKSVEGLLSRARKALHAKLAEADKND